MRKGILFRLFQEPKTNKKKTHIKSLIFILKSNNFKNFNLLDQIRNEKKTRYNNQHFSSTIKEQTKIGHFRFEINKTNLVLRALRP